MKEFKIEYRYHGSIIVEECFVASDNFENAISKFTQSDKNESIMLSIKCQELYPQ